MALTRIAANPLLSPEDLEPTHPELEILCTLNPAAVKLDGETLLLVRVGESPVAQDGYVAYAAVDPESGEMRVHRIAANDPDLDTTDPRRYLYRGQCVLTSISHLRIARATDGENFTFDDQPAIFPSTPYETFGCEDGRITYIDGHYYITYTSVSARGVSVSLASTQDFVTYRKHGVIFPPYQKDVCIFPEKVRRMYVCRHRPYKSEFNPAAIWTGYSPDLFSWGRHEMTLAPTPGGWEEERVGCGAPPIRTDAGWLEIYHACDARGRYSLGAMLSDLDHPEQILTRSAEPVLQPREDYERTGLYANCVFSNGMVADDDGALTVYYGAADRICAAATTTVDEMIAAAKNE